jgi:hypothetical protein
MHGFGFIGMPMYLTHTGFKSIQIDYQANLLSQVNTSSYLCICEAKFVALKFCCKC